jgi:hypothetical protein
VPLGSPVRWWTAPASHICCHPTASLRAETNGPTSTALPCTRAEATETATGIPHHAASHKSLSHPIFAEGRFPWIFFPAANRNPMTLWTPKHETCRRPYARRLCTERHVQVQLYLRGRDAGEPMALSLRLRLPSGRTIFLRTSEYPTDDDGYAVENDFSYPPLDWGAGAPTQAASPDHINNPGPGRLWVFLDIAWIPTAGQQGRGGWGVMTMTFKNDDDAHLGLSYHPFLLGRSPRGGPAGSLRFLASPHGGP